MAKTQTKKTNAKKTPQKSGNFLVKMSNGIERVGNKLPHPVLIFMILSLVAGFLSMFLGMADFKTVLDGGKALAANARGVGLEGWDADAIQAIASSGVKITAEHVNEFIDAGNEIALPVKNIFTGEGFNWIFTSAIKNFTGFAPLGVVLVAMLGIGIAEESGLISVTLKKIAVATPPALLPYMMVFLGIMSNIASDAGYVVLIPLGATLFYSVGRHPLAGMAAAFAGVSAGFSANLLPTPTDALLINLTNATLGEGDEISVISNYFFMIASTFVISIAGGLVTAKVVEPALGKYEGKPKNYKEAGEVTEKESRALRAVVISLIVMTVVFTTMAWPIKDDAGSYISYGPIGSLGGDLSYSNPFISSLVFVVTIIFAVMGIVYGKMTGSFGKGGEPIVKAMNVSMGKMGGYLVLAFFAAQFTKWFSYTQLDWTLAMSLADVIPTSWHPALVLFLFILVSMFLNLFIGSASAKWTLMAPIFVSALSVIPDGPMVDAAAVTAAYRVGDSVTNIISPLMSYFALIIVMAQDWEKDAGIGTIMGMMFPYSMVFFAVWSAFFVVWMLLGIPFGI